MRFFMLNILYCHILKTLLYNVPSIAFAILKTNLLEALVKIYKFLVENYKQQSPLSRKY